MELTPVSCRLFRLLLSLSVCEQDHVCRLLLSKMLKSMPELTGCSIELFADGDEILEELGLSKDALERRRRIERRRRRRERERERAAEEGTGARGGAALTRRNSLQDHKWRRGEAAALRVGLLQQQDSSRTQSSDHTPDPSEHSLEQQTAEDEQRERRSGRRRMESLSSSSFPDASISLIIVDGQMERMGGIETVQLLRSAGYRCPMIIASGSCMDSEKAAFRRAGADKVIGKPFSRPTLHATLRSLGILAPSATARMRQLMEKEETRERRPRRAEETEEEGSAEEETPAVPRERSFSAGHAEREARERTSLQAAPEGKWSFLARALQLLFNANRSSDRRSFASRTSIIGV